MAWYAVDAIDDAIDATREFLFPFSLDRWARLALVTLFIGGGGGGLGTLQNIAQLGSSGRNTGISSGVGNLPRSGVVATAPETVPGVGVSQLVPPLAGTPETVLLVLLGTALIVGIGIGAVGAVFEFVFVDALARNEIRIIEPSRNYLKPAVRYLAFQVGVALLAFGPLLVIGITIWTTGFDPGALAVLGVFFLVLLLGIPYLFVARFTREFVIPVMIEDGGGVVAAWHRLAGRLRQEWKQFGVYILLHFLVKLGIGIVRGVVVLVGALLIGIVALVIGGVVGIAIEAAVGGTGIGIGLLIAAVVGALAFLGLVALPLNVVVQTYVRSSELAALGGFDDGAFDLSPDAGDDAGGLPSELDASPWDRPDQTAETRGQTDRSGDEGRHPDGQSAGTTDQADGFEDFVPASDRFDEEHDDSG